MTDKRAKPKGSPAEEGSPPAVWGLHANKVLQKLQARQVEARMDDGTTITGALVGYNPYVLTLKTAEGVLLVNKGRMRTLGLPEKGEEWLKH